ncbi:MAG: hypothetical protein Q4G64_04740 [bacterium]|nr:hypothetical protein [bacterium]
MKRNMMAVSALAVGLALTACGGDENVVVPTGPAGGQTSEGTTSPGTGVDPTTPAPTEAAPTEAPTTEAAPTEAPTPAAPGASSEDGPALVSRTVDYLWNADSYRQEGRVTTSVTMQGQSEETDQQFTTDYVTDPLQMDMSTTQSQGGVSQEVRMILVPEEGAHRVYMSDLASGGWATYPLTAEEVSAQGFGSDPMNEALRNITDPEGIRVNEVPASAETNNEAAYEITVDLPSETVVEIVGSATGGLISGFDGTGTMTYLVAQDDGQPFTASATIEGVMTIMDMDADFQTFNESTFSNWNEITEIEVPAEAQAATEIEAP